MWWVEWQSCVLGGSGSASVRRRRAVSDGCLMVLRLFKELLVVLCLSVMVVMCGCGLFMALENWVAVVAV